MEANIEPTSSPRAFQDALGAGLPLEAILASMLVHFWTSGTPKNRALAVARCYFCRKWHDAPGAPKSSPKGSQNRGQKPPWRLQDGFKTRLKKGFDFGSHLKHLFVDFRGPRAERQNGFQNRFKNGLGFKARSFHPRKPSRSPFRFWSLRELMFEASAASSAAWPEARSPRSAWLTNGGRRCWRSHSQSADHRLRWNERA